MELIVITPPTDIKDEVASVKEMLESGLDRLHLRKENSDIDAYRNYLHQIPAVFHTQVSIHEYPELLNEFPLIGFHCKAIVWKDEKKLKEVLSCSSSSTISASFHSWEEVMQAPYDFDYGFVSPVFDSISKSDYPANIDITKLKATRQYLSSNQKNAPKIFALGGIDAAKIAQLDHTGFDGVAILGIVWRSDNCLAAFETIHRQIKGLQ
ncbi:thiamine phosphate synthase [Danxiaibacter flavus]|uniref:Thiamine phosphate synthase n=1 Tax=Danxiaibacter flavus TaxID=3049108 RepID=A0ABV3ZPH0_9BACT|nr:thiamine phosphate synthase [Chitinophagaceae bacterium DXS]